MTRKQLHGLAAAILIVGGLLLAFTTTVEAGIAGFLCAIAAAGVMIYASSRPRE